MQYGSLKFVVVLGLAGGASAEGYLSGNLGVVNLAGEGYNYYPGMISAGLGYKVNTMLSIEGRAGIGLWNGYIDNLDLRINSYFGGFFKPTIPIENGSFLYGLVGFGRGSVTEDAPSYVLTVEESGFSFGAGFSTPLNVSSDLTGEWVRLFAGDGFTVSQFSLGVSTSF